MSLGLYIHVPFCLRKCRYCDFVSYAYNRNDAELYLNALNREMEYYAQRRLDFNTVFIGGGTPSILETDHLERLLYSARQHFQWTEDAEVTMEANPGTLTEEKLYVMRRMGVNRLSLGVQACQQSLLNTLGRLHDYQQVIQAVQIARVVGFNNINIDLIFGIPGQTLHQWQKTLATVMNLQPEHLSCYSLQLEEGTPLAEAVAKGKINACPEELELQMYNDVIDFLIKKDYQHYEISNFSKPGFNCEHNITYWKNNQYLGVGPAAHSHMQMQRWSNTTELRQYANNLMDNDLPVVERHHLTRQDAMSETVFMGLRLIKGLDLDQFYRRFGQGVYDIWPQQINKLTDQDLIEMSEGYLRLTYKGLRLANQVFVEFV
ncbi:MAG: oxygen-independent coproporphyrinogen III oxidase [Firmicutes bacterium]|nr:oxygen-independent coproporphyrinogen III oxidase [Bacillota bacterium]